jgi:hypothetical protein
MKKLFIINCLTAFLMMLSFTLSAQDILVLTNGDSIQTKITEVTNKTISYKKFNYQDGPTVVVEIKNIKTIQYETGEIVNFEPKTTTPFLPDSVRNKLPFIINYSKQGYSLDDGSLLSKQDFKILLEENKMLDILYSYNKGEKMANIGKGILIGGMTAVAARTVFIAGIDIILLSTTLNRGDDLEPLGIGGSAFITYWGLVSNLIITGITLEAALPLIILGNVKQQSCVSNYNDIVRPPIQTSQRVSLGFGATSTGLGLTLHF